MRPLIYVLPYLLSTNSHGLEAFLFPLVTLISSEIIIFSKQAMPPRWADYFS